MIDENIHSRFLTEYWIKGNLNKYRKMPFISFLHAKTLNIFKRIITW